MRPVLSCWHGMKIYSYPAMLYLGLVFGVTAGNYATNLAGLNSTRVFIATILLLIPVLVGARLWYVALHWDIYREEPRRIWRRSEGGAALYGGLVLSLLASLPLLNMLQIPFWAFWDVGIFVILTGMVFTRIGCLLNGCCAGRPTNGRLSLYLPNHRGIWQQRIPTQLLEAGLAIFLLAGAVAIWNKLPFPGALFLYALAGYAMGRFILESIREQQERIAGNIIFHRIVSVALVVISLAVLFVVLPR